MQVALHLIFFTRKVSQNGRCVESRNVPFRRYCFELDLEKKFRRNLAMRTYSITANAYRLQKTMNFAWVNF
jgi:hypothetical protein